MKHLLTLTLFASAIAWGQNAPKLNARELFYAPPTNPSANPSNPPTGGQAGTNSNKSTASTTASTSTGKKQTTAKNTSGGGRPATGNTGASGSTSGGNTSSGSTTGSSGNTAGGNPGGAGNAVTGNTDTVVAQVGQQSTGQTHLITASVANGPLGLRYAVLKRDPSGAYREVDPDTSFRTGDAIRLQVETNTTGYLYVVTQGTSGQWQLLFPRPEVSGGSNRVEPHIKVEVPGDKGVWKFDEHAGTEKLFVVLARQPEADLDKLIYAIGNGAAGGGAAGGGAAGNGGREALMAQATIRDDVVSHLREQMLSRDLVFEKVDQGTADSAPVKNENAAYVVNISTAPDARVVKDFALQHR
jgi:hypothetical protein